MEVKLKTEYLKELKPFEELLSRYLDPKIRSVYFTKQQKLQLVGVYNKVTGQRATCSSCSQAWIKRLALWYFKYKKEDSKQTEESTQAIKVEDEAKPEPPKRGRPAKSKN